MKLYPFLFTLLVILVSSCSSKVYRVDLLIKDGRVIDGTGKAAFIADIGIRGDTIAYIGDRKAKKCVEAKK